MEPKKQWYNFLTDNGLPIPLIRHHGRGDLVATLAILLCIVVAFVMMFGGSTYQGNGFNIEIPKVDTFSSALVAIIPVLGTIYGYVTKRAQDKATGALK